MEQYSIDNIKVYNKAFLLNASYTSMSTVFSILSSFDIDSCISSKTLNSLTVIILPDNQERMIALQKILEDNKESIDQYYVSSEYSFIEISGHFIGGSNGLANATLDILRKNKINIEYQLMNPNRYSILIDPKKIKKAIIKFVSELGVRDSMITFVENQKNH